MKKLAILVAIATLSMFFASVAVADVPAPPVNQNIGFDDKVFGDLTQAECLSCHQYFGSNPDRHHMLYYTDMPDGICAATTGLCQDGVTECANVLGCDNSTGDAECTVTPRACYTDDDCTVGVSLCSNGSYAAGVSECVDASVDCGKQYQHPVCTTQPYCAGTSAAANVPGSQTADGKYTCLTCHEEQTVGGVTNFIVERDCTVCHVQLPNSPSVHHLDESQTMAKAGECVACHGTVVDNMDDGHIIPTYDPSLVTPGSVTTERICTETGWGPSVSCTEDADCAGVSATSVCDTELHKSATAEAGSCDFCHAPGTDAASGVDVVDNHDTHHGTGVYKDRYGNTEDLGTGDSRTICSWCHYTGYPHNPGAYDPIEIRTCENCHGMESLHSIQADSDASGTIVVGGELAGYGHVGRDNGPSDSDCWGCHGFSMASASAPGSEVIAPSISGSDELNTIIANTDAQITISGNALTGCSLELTDIAGAVTVIAADASDATSLTATINVPVGVYAMRAVIDGEASGAVALIAKPATGITITNIDMACGDCAGTATITGTGFGAEIPEGIQPYMNVMQGTIELTIVSWSDTEIVVSGVMCDGTPITVNGLFGSATK